MKIKILKKVEKWQYQHNYDRKGEVQERKKGREKKKERERKKKIIEN